MVRLSEKLTAPEVRPKVVQACVDLVEDEVAAKRGLSGAAIKAGFKIVKALKPGMIPSAIGGLLPDFARALQPIYDRSTDGAQDATRAFTDYMRKNQDETADALLAVTDDKARHAANRTLKKTYERLRGTAKTNVSAAVPGLARALEPFL